MLFKMLSAASLLGVTCLAQGTFVNLGFESAIIPGGATTGSLIPVGNAIPGWVAQGAAVGGGLFPPLDNLTYLRSGATPPANAGKIYIQSGSAIEGDSMVWLTAGNPNGIYTAYLAQTATLPADAASIIFQTASYLNIPLNDPPDGLYRFGGIYVTFNGQSIPIINQLEASGSGGPRPDTGAFYGDISQFAGQTGELRFGYGGGQGFR
jgi:hypothetical protein